MWNNRNWSKEHGFLWFQDGYLEKLINFFLKVTTDWDWKYIEYTP